MSAVLIEEVCGYLVLRQVTDRLFGRLLVASE